MIGRKIKHHTKPKNKTNKQIQYQLLDNFAKELFDHSTVYVTESTAEILNGLD